MPAFGLDHKFTSGRILAVIPARGGSKRLPGKNKRDFRGKPLLQWSIEQANACTRIRRTVVSSDDIEILEVAQCAGADLIVRPKALATDDSPTRDSVLHALSRFDADYVVLLQPTSPLRSVADIDVCLDRALMTGRPCVSTFEGMVNGAVYVAKAEWLREGWDFADGALYYEMPHNRSIDIDTLEDFELAARLAA